MPVTDSDRSVVLRCRRSAGEDPAVLDREASELEALGLRLLDTDAAEPDLGGVSVLVVHSTLAVSAALLERADRLSLVVTTTSGHDHIDCAAASRRGVRVARCPRARRDAVVETSMAMALCFLRDVAGLHALSAAGTWARPMLSQRGLGRVAGTTVGIVGHGVIGGRAAEAWRALGATVLVSDPLLTDSMPVSELALRSRVVSLHCSLTDSSRRLVDAGFLAAMSRGAILINTARGECVDIDALVAAEHLGGVGLDVYPTEPWQRDERLARELTALAARPGVLLTPHAAGYYDGLDEALSRETVETVTAWAHGKKLPDEVSC